MKATGIVRRIDDLGRVVIPKEIRRTMHIREGEPLEIFTERDGEVIFRKYSPLGEISSCATLFTESFNKAFDIPIAVCDRDVVVAANGTGSKELFGKPISSAVSALMEKRQNHIFKDTTTHLTEDEKGKLAYISPIISGGDVVGGVTLLEKEGKAVYEEEKKAVNAFSIFLSKQLEI